MNISTNDLNYISGILDGEGSLVISKSRNKKTKIMQYKPSIAISMNDKQGIEFIQNIFGGNIRIGKRKIHVETGDAYSPAIIIEYAAEEKIQEILTSVLPYIKVKKEQAMTLLDFINIKQVYRNCGKEFNISKFDINGQYNNYYRRMKSLKSKNWIK